MEVPIMGESAERQIGTQLSAPVAEVGSSLAASVAAESNFATAADAASMNPEVGVLSSGNVVSESKEAAMDDAERVTQLETNAISESDSSAAEEGTSSDDDKIETKRRKLAEWVIPNPVDTALHPTMDLPGKRIKITTELAGQQLTEALNQHALNLNTLVPVIEAWDETLTVYAEALIVEIDRRKHRIQSLDDLYGRTLQKQSTNSAALPLPSITRRATILVERLSRTKQKREAVAAGMSVLEDQHGAVQTLLNSMADYTATALAEIDTVTELMRNNARKLIRSTIANQQSQEETTPSVAASPDGAARQIDFTQETQAGKGTHHQGEGVIHLNVNGMQWPPLAGARGGGAQSYRDPFFGEPLYQQAFGLHQAMDNQTSLMIKDREVLGPEPTQSPCRCSSTNGGFPDPAKTSSSLIF